MFTFETFVTLAKYYFMMIYADYGIYAEKAHSASLKVIPHCETIAIVMSL